MSAGSRVKKGQENKGVRERGREKSARVRSVGGGSERGEFVTQYLLSARERLPIRAQHRAACSPALGIRNYIIINCNDTRDRADQSSLGFSALSRTVEDGC